MQGICVSPRTEAVHRKIKQVSHEDQNKKNGPDNFHYSQPVHHPLSDEQRSRALHVMQSTGWQESCDSYH